MSQQYIALLAQQRGLDFRTFDDEHAAVAWLLREAAPPPRDGGE